MSHQGQVATGLNADGYREVLGLDVLARPQAVDVTTQEVTEGLTIQAITA
ncbi:MAG: hypothetical protein LH624_15235 [Cryobacterium sp.]|nr:hypothetical protein [Cryobacterium sp.]